MKKMGESMEKVVDTITEILAFLTVILIVLVFVNRMVMDKSSDGTGFLPVKVANVMESIREIAILLIVGLAGLQFALKRGFIIFILYALLVAAAVIFLFFPGVLPGTGSKEALAMIL